MIRCGGAMLAAALALATPGRAATPPADAAGRVVARTPVPDAARRVGEVLLIARGDADVVLTLLDTKLLRRVVREIRAKEEANWPAAAPGHADAARYVAALEGAADQLTPRRSPGERQRRPRVKLYIDFVLTDTAARVTIGRWALEPHAGATRVVHETPVARLELSRDYVRRNMRLIAADAFAVEGAALDALLAPLTRLADHRTPHDLPLP